VVVAQLDAQEVRLLPTADTEYDLSVDGDHSLPSYGTLGIESWSDARGADVPGASPRGTYLQVSESRRQKIMKSEITEELPSQAKLTSIYGVSRSTIERALGALKREGVIESVQGATWYVAGTGDRRPLVERVTDLLCADVIRVGDRFPTESELCDWLGASRTAVRSAIAQVEGQGLIGKGATRGRVILALPVAQERQAA
jgi:DNA-binding GntR family transcriptional regulator